MDSGFLVDTSLEMLERGGGHSHCLTVEVMRCRVILVYETSCASNLFWDVVHFCVFIF